MSVFELEVCCHTRKNNNSPVILVTLTSDIFINPLSTIAMKMSRWMWSIFLIIPLVRPCIYTQSKFNEETNHWFRWKCVRVGGISPQHTHQQGFSKGHNSTGGNYHINNLNWVHHRRCWQWRKNTIYWSASWCITILYKIILRHTSEFLFWLCHFVLNGMLSDALVSLFGEWPGQ